MSTLSDSLPFSALLFKVPKVLLEKPFLVSLELLQILLLRLLFSTSFGLIEHKPIYRVSEN